MSSLTSSATPRPWYADKARPDGYATDQDVIRGRTRVNAVTDVVAVVTKPEDVPVILRAVNAYAALIDAARAAITYDAAIQACANDPARMASFCTAEGENLDALYEAWITKSRVALALAGVGSDAHGQASPTGDTSPESPHGPSQP